MFDENDDREMDEAIRRSMQVEVPAEVEDRLRRSLTEFRSRLKERPPSRLGALSYLLTHPPAARAIGFAAALLVVVAAVLVLIPMGAFNSSRVYAVAAEELRNAQSLEYTVVLNERPYVAVDLSFAAPAYRRFRTSWGIEFRADDSIGRQLVLLHATRTYATGLSTEPQSFADSAGIVAQLKSLPKSADEFIGEQTVGGRRLSGYRIRKPTAGATIAGLQALDVWVDVGSREVHHVDITIQEEGKPPHRMHINDIRVGATIDRSLFDLTPPAGYAALVSPAREPAPNASRKAATVRAAIRQADPMTVVVLPMRGSYLQTRAALQSVENHLKTLGITPTGAPLGRYESEARWVAGYPVIPGTRVEPPFEILSLPSSLVAAAVVSGQWGEESSQRWGAFVRSIVEQGYAPAGPAMEVWYGEDGTEAAQSTEMRMEVTRAN